MQPKVRIGPATLAALAALLVSLAAVVQQWAETGHPPTVPMIVSAAIAAVLAAVRAWQANTLVKAQSQDTAGKG